MKKISIIGANSNIARNFVFFLSKEKDIEIKLYDVQDKFFDGEKFEYKKINFLDKEQIKNIDFSCDALYLFSGKTGASKGFFEYDLFIDINEKILLNILAEISSSNAKCRLIYPSSRLVYGDNNVEGSLSEDAPKVPNNVYAIQKVAAENYIKAYSKSFGLEYTIFRIAIPFGELNPAITSYGMVGNFISQAKNQKEIKVFGDGSSIRTFTHIQDICEILWACITSQEFKNKILNIGGCVYSIKEICEKIADKYKAKISFVEWPELELNVETKNGWLNSSKLDALVNLSYKDILLD